MDQIIAAVAKTENIAILVLVLVCGGLYAMLSATRKEHREDRAADTDRHVKAIDRNSEALTKVGEALTEIRVSMAQGARNDRS